MTALPEATINNVLSELSVEQIDACDNPQIIQRVKGAKYILEWDSGRPGSPPVADLQARFTEWLASDAPFLLVDNSLRISVILLPEVPFFLEEVG